jgi:hypothetical protein
LGNFWRALQWKVLAYFMDICSILQPFGIFCGNLVHFHPFWYVATRKIWQPCVRLRSNPATYGWFIAAVCTWTGLLRSSSVSNLTSPWFSYLRYNSYCKMPHYSEHYPRS